MVCADKLQYENCILRYHSRKKILTKIFFSKLYILYNVWIDYIHLTKLEHNPKTFPKSEPPYFVRMAKDYIKIFCTFKGREY